MSLGDAAGICETRAATNSLYSNQADLLSCVQRIEGHFRTEQAARRRTEEALALAAGERDALRGQLEAERMQQVGCGRGN